MVLYLFNINKHEFSMIMVENTDVDYFIDFLIPSRL